MHGLTIWSMASDVQTRFSGFREPEYQKLSNMLLEPEY